MWWSSLFTDMRPSDFFNFSFLPKYGTAFVRGIEYTLLLAVVSVLLAVIPALLLALMRLSKVKPVRWLSGAYIRLRGHQPVHPRRGGAGAEQLGLCGGDLPRRYSGGG